MAEPILLPIPRRLKRLNGALPIGQGHPKLHLPPDPPAGMDRVARAVARMNADAPIYLAIQPAPARSDRHSIRIDPLDIKISATNPAAAFHAVQTLHQLLRQFPRALPCLEIEDSPDFPTRGVMLDISRDKVPTMDTLFALVDLLAELKLNQLQLYTEHTFAYRQHEEVWRDASPMTADEIRLLDAYCRERFIELVPNQNSFGHLERWFKHERYRSMAECPEGFTMPWGTPMPHGFTLNPLDPRSLGWMESLYDELLPNFSSTLFNVGCDETFDLGLGRSKPEVERRGRERVYLDFLMRIYDSVKRRGRTMMFWGDIILHKPELLGELPRDLVALNWGYEADHPFDREAKAFQNAGVPFYVCPGTSSWCSIAGRTDNAMRNLASAAEQGLKHGAIGYLNTDWGDWGHLQYLPVSYLGFAAGAAYSWCYDSNKDLPIVDALDMHVFRDPARVMGRLVYDLGNTYQVLRRRLSNMTPLFWALVDVGPRKALYEDVTAEEFALVGKSINAAVARLSAATMDRADAAVVADEIRNAGCMLSLACARGRHRLAPGGGEPARLATELRRIMAEHRRLWLARNRPGGLMDSLARLQPALDQLLAAGG